MCVVFKKTFRGHISPPPPKAPRPGLGSSEVPWHLQGATSPSLVGDLLSRAPGPQPGSRAAPRERRPVGPRPALPGMRDVQEVRAFVGGETCTVSLTLVYADRVLKGFGQQVWDQLLISPVSGYVQ